MKVKHLWAVVILSLVSGYASAQHWPFELWHEGRIVLVSGDTLKGKVKYDLMQDLVQYDFPNVRTEVFTPRKILFFEIFDKTVNRYRNFFTLPYNATTGYRTPLFFELMAEGNMTLLAREVLEYRTYNSPYYYGNFSRQVLVYKYFFLKEDGSIVEFTGNRNDLLTLMGNKSESVEKYMKENKLKFEEKYDLARIVGYYNSLFRESIY
ncbi:MAG TPA: hypothetical protein VKZ75_11845 [Cyclobacteriaceae bacterium]|nr:hypothetical protein [Cyclobacteriaceae bacterium]